MRRHGAGPRCGDTEVDVRRAARIGERRDGPEPVAPLGLRLGPAVALEVRIRRSTGARLVIAAPEIGLPDLDRSEEHTSDPSSLMRFSYAVFCLNKKIQFSAPS